jgi:ribosomal protein S17
VSDMCAMCCDGILLISVVQVLHKKMQKTASVVVNYRGPHPIYKKPVLKTKKYLVHDPEDKCAIGDKILFEKVLSVLLCSLFVPLIDFLCVYV